MLNVNYLPAELDLTPELLGSIPMLYAQDGKGDDGIAYAKFFLPGTGWTWYVLEGAAVLDDVNGTEVPLTDPAALGDVQDVLLFGLVIGFEMEYGYFALSEIAAARGFAGLPAERDLYWEPTAVSKIKQHHIETGSAL